MAKSSEPSHKLHLGKVGLTCTFCHSSAELSAAATDNNLPQAQLCLACHNGETAPKVDVAPLGAEAPAVRGFRFSHQQHLALGNPAPRIAKAIDSGKYLGHVGDIRPLLDTDNSCVACHRGLPQDEQVDSKATSRECPTAWSATTRSTIPSVARRATRAISRSSPPTHTRNFIDQHSTGKMGFDKLTCQPCHGRKFTCMGCH